MSFITLTQLTADSFQRANESPLNPAVWHTVGGLPGTDQLEILNNVCTTTIQVQSDGIASNGAIAWPDDQYISLQVVEMSANGIVNMYLRAGTEDQPCYRLIIGGPFNDNTGTSGYVIDQLNSDSSAIDYSWVDFATHTFQANDIITFAVIGGRNGHLYFLQNGNLIFQGALNASPVLLSSGRTGLQLDAQTPAQNDISVINFSGGSAILNVYSQPDCRVTPNGARNVQDTLTYDVPPSESLRYWFDTSFNRTEPLPVDSRAAGTPADSRTADNIPKNSRTPGTYGPGE
jgi:hypothetical protein